MIVFFFVLDHERSPRLFSSEPPLPVEWKRTKAREAWELARRKLNLLPQKTLRQEQAFYRAHKLKEPFLRILHAGGSLDDEARAGHQFRLFLQKHRTKRLFFLIGESLLLPFTALTMPLPGPNLAFYLLALLTITHWQSFLGIRALLKKEHRFETDVLLAEWEKAVDQKRETDYPEIIDRLETAHGLRGLRKVLWR